MKKEELDQDQVIIENLNQIGNSLLNLVLSVKKLVLNCPESALVCLEVAPVNLETAPINPETSRAECTRVPVAEHRYTEPSAYDRLYLETMKKQVEKQRDNFDIAKGQDSCFASSPGGT